MKPETQYIYPKGFDAARFGFTDKMSTQVEQWLSTCSVPAMRSAVESVFHSATQPERAHAAAVVADIGIDHLPQFLQQAITMAAEAPDARAVTLT